MEQTARQAGENEISGAKRLLESASLEKKIISGDAIFAQQELSSLVVEKGGEYLWKWRANQGNMYRMAVAHFEKMNDKYLGQASSLEKGHGRIDEREILSSFRIAGSMEFPYLAQVFRITRRSEEVKTGKISEPAIYGITSIIGRRVWSEGVIRLSEKTLGNRKRFALRSRCHFPRR